MKRRLVIALVLIVPDGTSNLFMYSNATTKYVGCVLTHNGKVIAYASKQLKDYSNP